MTTEQLENTLTPEQFDELRDMVRAREYNPNHPYDYYNAGGFEGHWETYTADEQQQIIDEVTEGV